MGFFKKLFAPAWMSESWEKAVKAVEKISDQNMLARVAREAVIWGARKAAVKKLTDPSVLAEVALKDLDDNVRWAALIDKKLTQSVLAEFAIQSVLAEFALKALFLDVRIAAVKMLTDQSVLEKVALKDSLPDVIIAAAKKLTDQSVLEKVALKASCRDVRIVAVEKLTDQSFLGKVALEDLDSVVRHTAVKKLADLAVLVKVALYDSCSCTRQTAVEKLTDQSVLEKVALQDDCFEIRKTAIKKLSGVSSLNKNFVKSFVDCVFRRPFYFDVNQFNFQRKNIKVDVLFECIGFIINSTKYELVRSYTGNYENPPRKYWYEVTSYNASENINLLIGGNVHRKVAANLLCLILGLRDTEETHNLSSCGGGGSETKYYSYENLRVAARSTLESLEKELGISPFVYNTDYYLELLENDGK